MKSLKILKSEKEVKESLLRNRLVKGWNKYSEANIYEVRCVKNHKDQLARLILPIENQSARTLEIGTGTGILLDDIAMALTQGGNCYGIDWSPAMLEKAREKSKELQKKYNNVNFLFSRENLEESLPYDDNFFDAAFSLQVICYIPGGWRPILEELERVLKPGGHLYVAPLVDEDFIRHAIKHFIAEFFRQPIVSIRGLKYRRVISEIAEEAKSQGAQFPDPEELTGYLENRFQNVKSVVTYWGGGRAIRAQKED